MRKCASWRGYTPGEASGVEGLRRLSSLKRGAPGPESAAVIRCWLPGPGGRRSGTAGWSAQRKMQRQEIPSHHGAADRRVAAAVGDDEPRRLMPLHQSLYLAPAQVHLPGLGIVGHLGDDVIGG